MRTTSLCLVALATAATALPAEYVESHQSLLWENFKASYNKRYSAHEEPLRRKIFVQNMLKAAKLEKQNPKAEFGMNGYSDLSAEEFKVYHSGNFPEKESVERRYSDEVAAAADPVDWRQKGAVTHVKNQGQCGSCWAFSTTGGIEGQWAAAGNTLTSLSEQMFVSCDKTRDDGCGGGLMDNAFTWLMQAHDGKVVTEESYPYRSGDGISGTCRWSSSMPTGAQIDGHHDIAHNEDEMATFVSTNGPLSIAVDAGSWQTYRGGVMSNCRGTRLDHGVLIVGWEQDYWIVKNSWGPNWGENGYIRLQKGTNQCGINKSPCSSEVKKN